MYSSHEPKREQKVKSKGRADLLEWHVFEDEVQWQESQRADFEAPSHAVTTDGAPRARRGWWFVLAVLLVALIGATAWVQAQQGLATIEAEVQDAVVVDAWLPDQGAGYSRFSTIGAEDGELVVQEMGILALGDGWARVRLIVQGAEGGGAYRQTRVYQQQGAGWQRVDPGISPSVNQWGDARQLESQYFIFHYFAQDEEAVAAAAPRLDALYPVFYAATLVDAPPRAKIVVMIHPTRTPDTEASGQEIAPDAPLSVPSPSALLAPVEVTEEEILAQGVALALFENLAAQSDVLNDLSAYWQPLHEALRLWLLWDQELSLARWREPLVRWVFWEDAGIATHGEAVVPAFAHELCNHRRLWMSSAAAIESQVSCFPRPDGKEGVLALRYPSLPPFALPSVLAGGMVNGSRPAIRSVTDQPLPNASVVAFATLFEYVSVRYGAEERGAAQVRAIVTMMPEYENWETLVPALFGLSKGEFEAEWNAYLRERYGVGE